MRPPRIFFITFLCIAITTAPGFSIYQECDKIEANAIVQNTSSPGHNDGVVKIQLLKGSLTNLRFIFCAYSNGQVLNQEKFHQKDLRNLPPGEYFCVVSNSDCSKKIDFTIK